MLDHLFEKYPGKLRLEIYHMPWSDKSRRAAEAALCAGAQGKFWEYHDLLFHYQKRWSPNAQPEAAFVEYAEFLELNAKAFQRCLDSRSMEDEVDQDKEHGGSLTIRSTPTVFVNETRIVGSKPADVYEQIIDEELKNKG